MYYTYIHIHTYVILHYIYIYIYTYTLDRCRAWQLCSGISDYPWITESETCTRGVFFLSNKLSTIRNTFHEGTHDYTLNRPKT